MAAYSEESVSAAIIDSMSLVGVEELKKQQSQAIRSFVTGTGKDVLYLFLYAILLLVFVSHHTQVYICIRVSPLTAFDTDQTVAIITCS